MRKMVAFAIAALTLGAAAQAKINPSEYTQSIKVESASIETRATGATVRNSPPSVLRPDGGVKIRDTQKSYVDVVFVYGNSRYEVTSDYGLLLQPGEYKMKLDKNYVEILIPDKEGKVKSCKYRIVGIESVAKGSGK